LADGEVVGVALAENKGAVDGVVSKLNVIAQNGELVTLR
jgi:hypothetical protein